MKYAVAVRAVLLIGLAIISVGSSGDAFTSSASLLAKGNLLASGGAAKYETPGDGPIAKVGYAVLAVNSGSAPYGTAVFRFKQNGVTVTEAGVPASPPTTAARIFIDYRTGVNAVPARPSAGAVDINTGIAIVNHGSGTAHVTYTLRKTTGSMDPIMATGHGTISAGDHFACFINELKDKAAPDFNFPPDFQDTIQFGSLEIASDQPLSVLALRGVYNQRNNFLITTTPVADVTSHPGNAPLYFPHFVDGGGYTTSLILMNASDVTETGQIQIQIMDKLWTNYGHPRITYGRSPGRGHTGIFFPVLHPAAWHL